MIWLILEARAEIQNKKVHFLVQAKTLKFASEIYWPLQNKNKYGTEDQKKGGKLQWIYFGHETEKFN